jgi:hypothetical protein
MFHRSLTSTRDEYRGTTALVRSGVLEFPTRCVDHNAKRGMTAMDLGTFGSLFSSLTLDDSSLALIALLAGMAGGWILTNWRDQQLRTKKLKANRKP